MAVKTASISKSKENKPVTEAEPPGSSSPACKTDKSGRRSLSGEMEKLQAMKLKKRDEAAQGTGAAKPTSLASRFFGAPQIKPTPPPNVEEDNPDQGHVESDGEVEEVEVGNVSVGTMVLQVDDEEYLEIEFELDEVEQEEGYRSPSPTLDNIRVSSPAFVPSPDYGKRSTTKEEVNEPPSHVDEEDGWGDAEDVFSSPIAARTLKKPAETLRLSPKPRKSFPPIGRSNSPICFTRQEKPTTLLVCNTPSPTKSQAVSAKQETLTVDLGAFFDSFEGSSMTPDNSQEGSSGVFDTDHSPAQKGRPKITGEHPAPSVADYAPESDFDAVAESELEDGETEEDRWEKEQARKMQKVAQGWKARYSLGSPHPPPVSFSLNLIPIFDIAVKTLMSYL